MDRKLIRYYRVNGFESLFKKEIPQFPVSSIYNVIAVFLGFLKFGFQKKQHWKTLYWTVGKCDRLKLIII